MASKKEIETPKNVDALAVSPLPDGDGVAAELVANPHPSPLPEGEGVNENAEPELKSTTISVKTRKGVDRFCRGGVCFTDEVVTVSCDVDSDATYLVSSEQIDVIKAESNLVVLETAA